MRKHGWLIGWGVIVAVLVVAGGAWAMGCCKGDSPACGSNSSAKAPPATTATSAGKPAPAVAKVVNTKCPIMGGAVDPKTVADALTREFKGQKVGFCCGGCPAQWDKLSDAEKEAKLKAVSGS
jgi:hypothetical protein